MTDIPIDTPLGKTTEAIRGEAKKGLVLLEPHLMAETILNLCDALEDAHGMLGCDLSDAELAVELAQEQRKLREAREENERLRAQAHGEECSGLSDADVDELVAICKRLRGELQQCHEELAEAWEVNIESVKVMLAEKRDLVKRFRSGGGEGEA